MNTQKLTTIALHCKNYIVKGFEEIKEDIYKKIENNEYVNEWKYILFLLDEAENNFKNNRFFSIEKAIKFVDKFNKKEMIIYKNLEVLNHNSKLYFFEFINEYGKYEYLDKIEYQVDLFEELSNYILAEEKFENELVNVDGYTIKTILSTTRLSIKQAYTFLIKIREEKQAGIDALEQVLDAQRPFFI